MKIISRKTFRKVVNISDRLNIWFKNTFGLDAKRKVLEAKQDLTTMDELDNTIGKALCIKLTRIKNAWRPHIVKDVIKQWAGKRR